MCVFMHQGALHGCVSTRSHLSVLVGKSTNTLTRTQNKGNVSHPSPFLYRAFATETDSCLTYLLLPLVTPSVPPVTSSHATPLSPSHFNQCPHLLPMPGSFLSQMSLSGPEKISCPKKPLFLAFLALIVANSRSGYRALTGSYHTSN